MPDETITTSMIQSMIDAAIHSRPTADEVRRMITENNQTLVQRIGKTETDVLELQTQLPAINISITRFEHNIHSTFRALFARVQRIDNLINTSLADSARRLAETEDSIRRHTDDISAAIAEREAFRRDLWGDDTDRPSISGMFSELRDGQKRIADRLKAVEQARSEEEIRRSERQRLVKVVAGLPWLRLLALIGGSSTLGVLVYEIIRGVFQ